MSDTKQQIDITKPLWTAGGEPVLDLEMLDSGIISAIATLDGERTDWRWRPDGEFQGYPEREDMRLTNTPPAAEPPGIDITKPLYTKRGGVVTEFASDDVPDYPFDGIETYEGVEEYRAWCKDGKYFVGFIGDLDLTNTPPAAAETVQAEPIPSYEELQRENERLRVEMKRLKFRDEVFLDNLIKEQAMLSAISDIIRGSKVKT